VARSCKDYTKLSSSSNRCLFLEQLSNYQLLAKDSIAWTSLLQIAKQNPDSASTQNCVHPVVN
jgi:hypothetical protein